ncbi:SGNH hydrolase-type esterase domain-containing protein [Tanacetum coccineum]
MTSSLSFSYLVGYFVILMMVLRSGSLYVNGCYTSIISFGDSLADTGSQKELSHISHQLYPCLYSPYGETFFHKPTGRCSNGRLIIDFLAESLGLPMIQPFLHNKHKIENRAVALRQGVNYAVAGATALDSSFLEAEWPERTVINASLEVQLTWFKQSLPSICGNTSDCKSFIKSSLILMGEIGGNDYSFLSLARKSIDEVKPYVHLVTDMIISTVNGLWFKELTRIPIWVKLHDVPIQVFEEYGISLIATYLGKPIMLDSYKSSMCIPDLDRPESVITKEVWRVSKGFQVGKEFAYQPKASNVGSIGNTGTRGETSSKAGPSKNTNDDAPVITKGTNTRQQDTDKKKISNIASPNPFAVMGVDDDEEEECCFLEHKGFEPIPLTTRGSSGGDGNNLSVCAILESHADVAAVYDTCKKVCSRWKWTSNGSLYSKGSWIILGWNDDLVDVIIMA